MGQAGGDRLTGAINNESPLVRQQVEQVGEETRLSAIVRLMERAATEKPRIVEMADRIATRVLWPHFWSLRGVADRLVEHRSAQGVWITVSVLVVTCPCALSLATPVTLTVASGRWRGRGAGDAWPCDRSTGARQSLRLRQDRHT